MHNLKLTTRKLLKYASFSILKINLQIKNSRLFIREVSVIKNILQLLQKTFTVH